MRRLSLVSICVLAASFLGGQAFAQPSRHFKRTAFAGVSFSYGSSLAHRVVGARGHLSIDLGGTTIPAIDFSFSGYLVKSVPTYAPPEIQIFAANTGTLLKNPDARTSIVPEIHQLRNLLAAHRPLTGLQAIPYVLPRMDSAERIVSRAHYIHFKDGSGIAFVTAMGMRVGRISNATPVVWAFRGLTSDGRWVIAADFPLRVSALPNTSPPGQGDWRRRDLKVQAMLNRLPDHAFVPYLSNLDRVASSLSVHPTSL
ncbi:MAG TPA: hypothetical protein VFB58_18730 [Chloroflexota bacterium]|nr:hypothetical protein [Chloroflexota bacterium]